ncbi:hypothetical protein PM082_002130 [Marasmius tenuissimus]|nr:hypothetical protein PM082_002130 [Marasmius tenuissimus]
MNATSDDVCTLDWILLPVTQLCVHLVQSLRRAASRRNQILPFDVVPHARTDLKPLPFACSACTIPKLSWEEGSRAS